MSLAISRSKYSGDPGIFGDIFGAIKGAVGGAVTGFLGSGGAQGSIPQTQSGPGGTYSRRIALPSPRAPIRIGPVGIDPRAAFPGGAPLFSMEANGACPTSVGGYHLNKSDYFLKSGEYVPAGSRYVRNRKRNPANARATSRAISRVVGAKRYAKSLSRVSIRKHSSAH